MIRFSENYSLRGSNTFGVEAYARYFYEFTEVADLQNFLHNSQFHQGDPLLILGGGSNLLLTGNFDGWVLYPNLPGISIEKENRSYIWLRVGSGVVWDEFVDYVVREGWGGAENMSLIPGKVGAAPVQNIGAYGQEVSEIIESVAGVDIRSGEHLEIPASGCDFNYRQSIFKNDLKGMFVITSVLFRLEKFPIVQTEYQEVAESIKHIPELGIGDVREAVVAIRRSKLPDPAIIGNAGSFFKNPLVPVALAEKLQEAYPGIPIYITGDQTLVKISAGWLIDQCGWKGYRRGDAGVHEKHALVLVNYGNATGKEIFGLSGEIQQSVAGKFGVQLEREVNVAGEENYIQC